MLKNAQIQNQTIRNQTHDTFTPDDKQQILVIKKRVKILLFQCELCHKVILELQVFEILP